MKKVLSIMLVAMMLTSLFAVNASASVATYEGFEVKTIFDTSADVKSAMPYIRLQGGATEGVISSFSTVDENEVAVLKVNTLGSEWLFGSEKAKLATLDKIVFEFDVKAVDCSNGLIVGLRTGSGDIGFMVSPATFVGSTDGFTDGGIGSAKVADPSVLKTNQWFNFRVTVDTTKMTDTLEATRRSAMTIEYKKAEDETYAAMPWMTGGNYAYKIGARAGGAVPSWTNTGVAISAGAEGYAFCKDAEDNSLKANAEYHIDNVRLTGRTNKITYPSTGVLVAENFEGTSPAFAGGQATVEGDETNKYIEFYQDNTTTADYGASGTKTFTSLPQEFVVTADVYKETDNTQNFIIEYFTDTLGKTDTNGKLVAGSAAGLVIDASKFETGKWYTVKIARVNVVYPIVTMVDKETGETQNFNATTRANISGSTTYNRMLFRALNTASSVSHWRIDNVTVAEAGAASIIGKTVDETTGATTVKVSVDAKAYTATPVLATFASDRLVAADFADVTLSADGATADLALADSYDEAVLYLWNGLGGAPFMEAWDITAELAE